VVAGGTYRGGRRAARGQRGAETKPAPPASQVARGALRHVHPLGSLRDPGRGLGRCTHHGEWIRDTARIPLGEYDRFQPQWNPTAFDADAWARLAAAAGMKYLVITSKHHDGFCLYEPRSPTGTSADAERRDILGELGACASPRRALLHLPLDHGLAPSRLPAAAPWETARSTDGADFRRFESYLHAQVTEIVQRYRTRR
jgi:alpha-L-fucosidase